MMPSHDLMNLIVELQEAAAIEAAEKRLADGDDPWKILEEARLAMGIVGRRFAEGTYFIPELIFSGQIMHQVAEMVKPKLGRGPETERLARVVLGTVSGDLHDIGKNLVTFMLDINGFEVHDLGVDVSPQMFVDKIREVKPQVVGLSGFLTSVYQAMKDTVDAIAAENLRDRVKIMIGGGVMDEQVRKFCGADAYGPDAMAAVALAKGWMEGSL